MMMRQANKVKRREINLNYLRNDLDLWLHRVASWIDNKKTNPPQDDIKTLGIEMVQKLCIRKVLKKKDIDDMKFPGLHLTPNRSSSASPNRHTTPDSASRRSKSITRLSPEDQHSDCQKKLDFNNDEDGYKVDADINPATCTCAHDETFYKCGISLLEKQKIKLEKELQSILTTEQDETLCLKTRSYEYTIQNQKKLILEFQKREEEQKIALKNANDALEQHIHMLEICREEKNEAESILSDYLIKNDSVKLHCEIAQLQKNLKKQKQTADEQIHNFKKYLKEKENDLQQGTKRFNEMNEKLKEMERQGKYISFRNEKELLQEQKNNRILVKDNESLREKILEIENNHAEERKQQIDIQSKFKHEVSNLKVQNSIADKKVTNVEKDLEEMTSKCKEEQSVFNSKRCQLEREIKELRLQLDEMRKSTEYRCYSAVESRSDTEKEHISLRSELTEALKNIEKIRQEYTDLSKRYETGKIATKRTIESLQQEKDCLEQEKVNFRAELDQIQSDLNLFKNEQVHQQDSSHGTIENLFQQNRKLDNDRELLRGKIFSLENDKIKLEDILNKIKEDNKKLQSDHGKLQDNIREKSNEIKDSEVRYKKETSDRISSDNTSTKLKDENDRLRRERNSARIELQRVLREKEQYYQNINTEQVLAREELQNKERKKSELVALFKDKEDKDLQKIKLYEKDIETLKSRCREDNDKMRQSEHDVETLKSRCRDDKDKIQRLEREIETLKSRLTGEKANQYSAYEMLQYKNDLETCKHQKKALEDEHNKLQKEYIELENELQSLNSKLEQFHDFARNTSNLKKQIKDLEEGFERNNREKSSLHKENKRLKYTLQEKLSELKTLETRLSEEGSDQTLEQIGKGSIIRAQTMVNYDKLFAEKSEEVTKRVSELYENKWKVAMKELGENGGKKKNIEFLLKILENAYSFCERMEGRFTDEFEQAMLNGAVNIKEVVDTTVFVRPILERLERCINQMFLREYSEYQEHRTSESVYTYITEALSLSWFMVTRNPRVFISTTIPKESHPQLYDSYSTDGSEVDYVVLPIVKWSTNENEIIRKGIAAFK